MLNTFQSELYHSMIKHKQQIAIEGDNRSLTYEEVLSRANYITHMLLNENLNPETVVGIMIKDRIQMITAVIGCINARCCFVPIDPDQPIQRQERIADHLDLAYLISSEADVFVRKETKVLRYDQSFAFDVDHQIDYPEFHQDDSIYIYYTSGSTGTPKGIVGRNVSLLQFLKWEIAAFDIQSDCRVSQLISPYFDAFLRDIFVPLLTGGTICIPVQNEETFAPDKLHAWIKASKVSLIHCVLSVFRSLNSSDLKADDFENLKHVLMSGEKIKPQELTKWYSVFADRIQLVNLYGATETTMIRSFYLIKPGDAQASKIPIGKPIDETELWIVDENLKRCKKLITGQILIVSDYISKGYFNDAEQNEKKFISVTLKDGSMRKAFLTGDYGRELADGNIDLIGRDDRQIKLMGIRIEPEEIENVMLRVPFVQNAIIGLRSEAGGVEALLAFFVRKPGFEVPSNVHEALEPVMKDFLPAAMMPSKFIELDAFPLLPNGKINLQELLNTPIPVELVNPVDDIETKLLGIWKEILGDKPISTIESFQAMGGNSLSIMKLIGKIYGVFKVRVPLQEIFKNRTIQKQAVFIRAQKTDDMMVIKKATMKPAYHLSAAQERLYFSYKLNPQKTSFNLPMVWEIHEAFSVSKVKETLVRLISRHESLRTIFIEQNEVIMQVIREEVDFHLDEIFCSNDEVQRKISDFIRPFDLSKDILFRSGIISTDEGKHFFIMDLHHIICDGISQTILLTDFTQSYYDTDLSPLSIQLKDYAEWEYDFMLSTEYVKHREFWLGIFEKELPHFRLPVSNPLIDDLSDKGGNISFSLTKELFHPVFDLVKKDRITLASGIFSLYFLFISRLSGQDDLVIGSTTSGRMQEELEKVVGMFVKTLPVRAIINYDSTFSGFVKYLHELLIEINSKQIYDLSNIMSDINSKREHPLLSLFEVVFVFLDHEKSDHREATRFDFQHTDSKYPLTLYVKEYDDVMDFRLEYSNAYFTASDMELLAEQFQTMIRKVMSGPDTKIIELFHENNLGDAVVDDNIIFNI
ncbi:non-ribosomal peptide synthetase [Pedobacter steynii]|uniref:Carrier domain-containing protein n=1 Tax=Pedobacter steynii TaxID=430522 RepID=A0A1D7QNB6_9SPHI|nr:non-ribosomal peptide synthetase [Pedobacter steynii]AOM80160.1 hypothetical protein BFS30_25165 [Pedobacter steynii]